MRDPGSLWSPLPESGKQGTHVKDKFIVHSTGDRGSAEAIYRYFARAEVVVESTFVVGLTPADPTRQLLDSSEYADANLNANGPGISVEVVGTATDPFTEWQVAELIRLGRWARANHPIPAQVCPAPTSGGLGWHIMFGTPGPWTPAAKDCPGKTRIAQLQSRVFPAIISQEDDLTPEQARQLADIHTWVRGTDPNVDSFTVVDMGLNNIVGLLVGGNTGGKNNFHWVVEQIVAAIAAQPGASLGGATPQQIADAVLNTAAARLNA